MSRPGVPSCLLLLAALSSAAVTDGAAKREVAKAFGTVETTKSTILLKKKDLSPQESKKVQSHSPSKRHRRKFDFDAEFASYLGLASQEDTARYLAGDKDSSYKASPTALQDSPDGNLFPPLRLVPGSTPASFAYFAQIYPDEHSDGDIRIEHFSPVIHPLSADREKSRYRDDGDEDEPVGYERSKSNYYPQDVPLYAPPTSRSYFGRYSNKKKYSESSEDEDGPKLSKIQAPKQPYEKSKGFDDDSAPDYKMGYRHVGMYHKFQEEDLYPKKTSSEWIPLKKSSQSRTKQGQEAGRGANSYEPEGYHDARLTPEDFHVKSEHDDEVTRIKTNIENEPPYSTNNFDLVEKNGPSIGKLKNKGTTRKGAEEFGKGHSPKDPLDEPPFEPLQRVRKHKRRRKKHRRKHHHHQPPHHRPHPHHHGRPGFRSSPEADPSVPFTSPEKNSGYKAPTFEFHNPVNSYVSPPYSPPETNKQNLKAEPFKNQPESYGVSEEPDSPPEPFQAGPENDSPVRAEVDKDGSFEEPADTSDEPADVDYGPLKLDEFDEDYHIIKEAGPREHAEHSKDFDKRLPEPDGPLYGSFESFDGQLDSTSNKKFEPFVKFPFDEQRKKLKTVVEELIESGKSR